MTKRRIFEKVKFKANSMKKRSWSALFRNTGVYNDGRKGFGKQPSVDSQLEKDGVYEDEEKTKRREPTKFTKLKNRCGEFGQQAKATKGACAVAGIG